MRLTTQKPQRGTKEKRLHPAEHFHVSPLASPCSFSSLIGPHPPPPFSCARSILLPPPSFSCPRLVCRKCTRRDGICLTNDASTLLVVVVVAVVVVFLLPLYATMLSRHNCLHVLRTASESKVALFCCCSCCEAPCISLIKLSL